MLSIGPIFMMVLGVLALLVVVRQLGPLRSGTLRSASIWALAAAVAFCISAGLEWFDSLSTAGGDFAWYATAVLGLCPLIAVLGARRPGAAVWNWFVVTPLLAVLLWPAAVSGFHSSFDGLRIDVPPLAGFTFVLVMGCGNYLGTRFWLAALLYGFAEFLLAAPVTAWGDTGFANSDLRWIGLWCWPLAVVLAWSTARSRVPSSTGPDRAWFDFRDAFGIVWARRLQDRVNERGASENWAARLDVQGFQWAAEASRTQRDYTAARIDHTLRWLLRRFVDDAWLNARLGPPPSDPTPA
jgi:hypothetical protein